jgi:ribonuclease PH
MPLTDFVAATSVGLIGQEEMLDLCYEEDSNAIVDMNVIMTGDGNFIEVQATGEQAPFNRSQLNKLLEHAESGIKNLIELQRETLGEAAHGIGGITKDEKVCSSQ